MTACEDSSAPEIPTQLRVESGNGQYSKRGSSLVDPLVVRLRYASGTNAADFRVRFEVGTLGGTVSTTVANTNAFGLASTRLTLPDQVGTARVRAYLEDDPNVYADFSATSADFYCPEENPTFVKKFFSSDPTFNELLLFTRKSALFPGAGIVRVTPAPSAGVFIAQPAKSYDMDSFLKVVRDAAFSASGDLFLAWSYQRLETIHVESDFTNDEAGFSALESLYGSEIEIAPAGVLVGCDEFGPFAIGCRDTLGRFAGAEYGGRDAGDYTSGDAVAVDVDTEDIYYIHITGGMLKRLPIDNLQATGAPVDVVALTQDEAQGASGMVVDDRDGSVYILVDTENTRAIVKVTSGGTKSTEVDFLTHPETMAAPGRQNDLAIDRKWHYLFTIDRTNDALIMYEIIPQVLHSMTANPADTDPEALSTAADEDERIGLVVIPDAGL